MGEVYRARDTRLGRDVALKILPIVPGADPQLRIRFEREAQALAALSNPHIAAIYDVIEVADHQTIVMELVPGPTLAQVIPAAPFPSAPRSATPSISATLSAWPTLPASSYPTAGGTRTRLAGPSAFRATDRVCSASDADRRGDGSSQSGTSRPAASCAPCRSRSPHPRTFRG